MKFIRICTLWSAMLTASGAHAQAFDHSHMAFTTLLKKHVVVQDGGKASHVRYAELAKDRAPLKAYLDAIAAVKQVDFDA